MFAQPAALLFLVTKKLADGKPLERFFERAFVRSDHARQRRRQLGSHRHFAIAFVGKIEKLIDDFGTAFFALEIGWLEHGAVPFDETVAPSNLTPAREDVIPRRAIVGQKVSETWERLHDFKNRSGTWARTTYAVE